MIETTFFVALKHITQQQKHYERRQCFYFYAASNSLKNISIFSYYFLVSSNFDLRVFIRKYQSYDVATCM